MREIKFRGYHPDAKDMVYFGLGENNIRAYSMEDGYNYTFLIEHDYPIMQFTGLFDKNGTEIYEGDICDLIFITGDEYGESQVTFEDGAFSLTLHNNYKPCLYEADMRYIEVIGNIHENPKLLVKI